MAHASIEVRSGRAPFNVESGRSSTAARIAIPMRVRVSRSRSPSATRIATPIVIAWWMVIVVEPRSIGALDEKNVCIGLLTPGSQMSWAKPIRKSSSEIDTTSFTASVVFWSPRMITSSSRTPNSGANTSSTTTSASGADQPQSKRSCQ